jgi:uncharacterized protein
VIQSTIQKHSPAVAILARAPEPGKAKTRLSPLLGPEGAATFQAALLSDALRKVASLGGIASFLFVFWIGALGFALGHIGRARNHRYILAGLQGRDLGERLERAFHRMLRRHWRVLVIGTDSPELSPRVLRRALDELRWCDAVLGPCPDGGYYLIGLRRFKEGLFRDVRWGTSFAFRDTLRNLVEGHFSCSILEPLLDIDRPADFRRLSKSLSLSPRLRRLAPATWSFVKNQKILPFDVTTCPRRTYIFVSPI